jgi:enediyne biosynthesis protein E5
VSPGQWGSAAFFAFLMACLGGLVVNRAARSDVTYAFLFFHLSIVFGRSLWLGEPMAIPLHRVQSGALLLFAFFMISDPKTTPDSRAGRVLFAALVALGGGYVQFKLFRTNGLLYSLAATALLVPLIDRLFPGPRYQWTGHPPRRD